jgi:hypothetical protein
MRSRLLGPLLLGLLLVTAGCGDTGADAAGLTGGWSTAGCEFSREPATVTVGNLTMPATPPALDAAMARIERAGRADFADSYAGLEVDQAGVRAIVYRVPSAVFDEFVRHAAENTCVVVRDAAHGLSELTRWHDRVVADLGVWKERGIRISTVGARHDGTGVEVGTPDVAGTREALAAHYGAAAPLIFLEQGPVTPLPRTGRPVTPPQGG